jgi:hypothetical protein
LPSLRVLLALAFDSKTLRAAVIGYLVPIAAYLLAGVTGIERLAEVWGWLFIPAVVYHGLLTINTANNPARLSAAKEQAKLANAKLDPERRRYLSDMRQIHTTVLEKVQQSPSTGLRSDLSTMASELNRLVDSLEELLIRNQQLEDELHRYETARYKPQESTLDELRKLNNKQSGVITNIARAIATMDANITLIIHQYDEGDREDISHRIQEMNDNLVTWRQSIQEVYGT